jgi:HAE1 family hydrophobic/amphiphilic exporter-1
VIPGEAGTPLRIRDIGRVEDGTKEQRSLARLNGVPTVILEIRRQSGANTIAVIEGIKAALPTCRAGAAGREAGGASATSRATSRRRCTRSRST